MKFQLRHYVSLAYLYLSLPLVSQDILPFHLDTSYMKSESLEVLNEENIDFFSNGFIRSTTNIFNFNLGHPEKFYVPFYLLLGTTADVFNNDRFINEDMVFDMLNANGGLINGGYKISIPLNANKAPLRVYAMNQLSVKSITGIIFESGEKETFVSYMGNIGVMIQVDAWNPEDKDNQGRFWLHTSTSISANPKDELRSLFSENINPYFLAVHIESGISLSHSINIKGGYFRFINNQNIIGFDQGHFKLTGIYNL
ncbi:hypothetical protein N9L92_03495 [Saprospiraceae bacterium]|nr:hypothetical protein [Saprospiraceae bacterium]